MFKGIRNFFLRAAAESAIDRAERQNAETAHIDPWTPTLDDRRRLAVSEIFMLAERQDGVVHPSQIGSVILNNVTDESEVTELADKTTQTVNRRIQRGMMG